MNFPRLALFGFALIGLLSGFACASYIVELTYSGGVVTQTGVYYTNAEPSSPGGNFTYTIGSSSGSLNFPILEMHDARNNESEPAGFAPVVKKTEAVAYIVVPDSAIPSTGTGASTDAASNLKIMNGTQVLLDEPLKTPTRLVPSVAPQVGQTTTTGSSTETTTPGTTQGSDDGAGLDLFIGLIIGAVIVVAILVFLRKKGKK